MRGQVGMDLIGVSDTERFLPPGQASQECCLAMGTSINTSVSRMSVDLQVGCRALGDIEFGVLTGLISISQRLSAARYR
jgi:hypothetical protein